MRRSILPCALVLATLALAGCGNKGPLFMPPPPAPGTTTAPKAVPHPAAASTVPGPAPTSTTMSPFNSVIHQ
ncbi:MAG: hypothetical protein GAK28_03612 [Luteibacter sp.]|uniref:LPS translocon maturation chaperone LptM n=1 Tax=Luteibacter sp. TaxID=1886636 RepID=UPI00137CAFEF|nr:lipoprotein [Luteibacter sp.]KAF1004985.1 MAG: hypothetical protein GAK28_03612 [Luteibacter sp.]